MAWLKGYAIKSPLEVSYCGSTKALKLAKLTVTIFNDTVEGASLEDQSQNVLLYPTPFPTPSTPLTPPVTHIYALGSQNMAPEPGPSTSPETCKFMIHTHLVSIRSYCFQLDQIRQAHGLRELCPLVLNREYATWQQTLSVLRFLINLS